MHRPLGAALTAALSVQIAAPVWAQVTPEDVWQNWQKLGASYGQALVADSVVRDGDTLVVSGMSFSMDQDIGRLTGGIDELRFRDTGNGTVEVTMSDTYRADLTLVDSDGKTQTVALSLTQPGVTIVAGGSASRTEYTYAAPSVIADLRLSESGASLADLDATLTGLAGTYVFESSASLGVLDTALLIDRLAFSLTADDPEAGATVTGALDALKIASSGSLVGLEAMENLARAMRDGMTFDAELSYGAGNFTIDARDAGKATKVVATNQTGHFRTRLGNGALRYGAGGTGVTLVLSGDDIPFPALRIAYGEAAFDVLMPLLRSDQPTDFSLLTRIVDLAVSDEIWAMFDPTATLPRDPATLVLDARGKLRLTADLVDDAAMTALGEASPGEIHALDVEELQVTFAGAELTGSGALTFDNSDVTTFDGVPAPTGKIDLMIRGGNRLLDRLVAMGIVPQDQVMGARMMIALLAKPGEGEDVLNSALEFRDKGFFANGQRLK